MNIYELVKQATPAHVQGFEHAVAKDKLRAHAAKHFMEALESLKLAANAVQCDGRDCKYCDRGVEHPKTPLAEELTVLVAKLEEV